MQCLKEYLEKLEISNPSLIRQITDVNIKKVLYFKEDKIVYFYLTSKEIIPYEVLNMLREELIKNLTYFKDIKIKIRYSGFERKSNKDIIKRYFINILYILKTLCPAISGFYHIRQVVSEYSQI